MKLKKENWFNVSRMHYFLLVVFLLVPLTSMSEERCGLDDINGTIDGKVKWKPDYFRTDNEPIEPKDHAGYKIYWTETGSGDSCTARIADRLTLEYAFKVLNNRKMNFNITQIDSGGRESKWSNTQVISTKVAVVPIGKPAAVDDLTFSQIDETKDYNLTFSEVTTYWNGNTLPVPPVKYYIFSVDEDGNDIVLEGRDSSWLGDYYTNDLPQVFTAIHDVHYFAMETDFKLNDQHVVSDRSEIFILDTVPPAIDQPAEIQWIVVPDGHGIQYRIVPLGE